MASLVGVEQLKSVVDEQGTTSRIGGMRSDEHDLLESSITRKSTIKQLWSRNKWKGLGHFLLCRSLIVSVKQIVSQGRRLRALLHWDKGRRRGEKRDGKEQLHIGEELGKLGCDYFFMTVTEVCRVCRPLEERRAALTTDCEQVLRCRNCHIRLLSMSL